MPPSTSSSKCGGSTGTNFFGACELISDMIRHGRHGSIVTLICDDGNRYLNSYFNRDWLTANGYDIDVWVERYRRFFHEGRW